MMNELPDSCAILECQWRKKVVHRGTSDAADIGASSSSRNSRQVFRRDGRGMTNDVPMRHGALYHSNHHANELPLRTTAKTHFKVVRMLLFVVKICHATIWRWRHIMASMVGWKGKVTSISFSVKSY